MLARVSPSGLATPYNFKFQISNFKFHPLVVQERVFMWSILDIRYLKDQFNNAFLFEICLRMLKVSRFWQNFDFSCISHVKKNLPAKKSFYSSKIGKQ